MWMLPGVATRLGHRALLGFARKEHVADRAN
jgi:hypothetical protein